MILQAHAMALDRHAGTRRISSNRPARSRRGAGVAAFLVAFACVAVGVARGNVAVDDSAPADGAAPSHRVATSRPHRLFAFQPVRPLPLRQRTLASGEQAIDGLSTVRPGCDQLRISAQGELDGLAREWETPARGASQRRLDITLREARAAGC